MDIYNLLHNKYFIWLLSHNYESYWLISLIFWFAYRLANIRRETLQYDLIFTMKQPINI